MWSGSRDPSTPKENGLPLTIGSYSMDDLNASSGWCHTGFLRIFDLLGFMDFGSGFA